MKIVAFRRAELIENFYYSDGYQAPVPVVRRSKARRLLRLWVRIPQKATSSVCCDCCVLSRRGLCDELIARPEESHRLVRCWV